MPFSGHLGHDGGCAEQLSVGRQPEAGPAPDPAGRRHHGAVRDALLQGEQQPGGHYHFHGCLHHHLLQMSVSFAVVEIQHVMNECHVEPGDL